VCLLGLGRGSISMLATLAQCVIIQMCVLPMYEELEERSPAKFRRVLGLAFGTLTFVFGLFAALGYAVFGPGVQPNVLLDLPDSPFANAAQLGVIAVVAAIYPIMLIPMVAPIRNLSLEGVADAGSVWSVLQRKRNLLVPMVIGGIILISFVGALYIESLGLVNVIGGSVSVGMFTALCPGLVGLRLLHRPLNSFAMYGLLVFGLAMTILGLVFDDNYRHELDSHCAWHRGGAPAAGGGEAAAIVGLLPVRSFLAV